MNTPWTKKNQFQQTVLFLIIQPFRNKQEMTQGELLSE